VVPRLTADPLRTAVLTDFDGTLSRIVDDPAAALPLPGVPEVLSALDRRYGRVAVISGRPVSYLVDRLGSGLWLSGLYGLEAVEDGERIEAPEAAAWRPVIAESVARARELFGDLLEDKGLSLTLHFRSAPDREGQARAWAAAEHDRTGLVVRPAKSSVELHPPVDTDKGTVVESIAGDHDAVVFLGDDVGDLPAFDALDRLADRGLSTLRVGVHTPEAPPEVLRRADLVVEGPEGALGFLQGLLVAP
jgi:trehalose 6-phosphate phosphatase